MELSYKLESFEGPLDLLLHLIEKNKVNIYISLVASMIAGRLVWGVVQLCCVGFDISKFSLSAFWTGAVVNAIPGVIIQLVLIPVLVMVLEMANKQK